MRPKHQERLPSASRGFSLVEMAVTVAIFALISTVVIVRNAEFDNQVLLQALAYDIALSVREAQQFGINVRVSGNEEFRNAYGVHFESESPTYYLFRDLDDDGVYDAPTELLETYSIGRGAMIGGLCDMTTEACVKTLDIVFRRPDPDAVINGGTIAQASIELVPARQEGGRLIVVESTGQISIQQPSESEAQAGAGDGDTIDLPPMDGGEEF